MPRELTRQSAGQEAADSRLKIKIRIKERTVWVALSGILDRQGVDRIIARVTPHLYDRNRRIVLGGEGLLHLDYRATRSLILWNRNLRQYRHQLFLQGWSEYLKAILCMEDWDRELDAPPAWPVTWPSVPGLPADLMP